MEWLTEKRVLATRDINSNSAGETEELIEKQEKVIDQLDKKRKVDILFQQTAINFALYMTGVPRNYCKGYQVEG